ncbi:hypothetical protein EU514_13830, partial [Pseudomonas fragi]|nr:hypothetical protein [Pseudomonas fragi]
SATSTTCAFDLSLAGGEFYSVTRCCQHLISCFDDLKLAPPKTIQLIETQGVFRFDCAGSGTNYRPFESRVKHLFEVKPQKLISSYIDAEYGSSPAVCARRAGLHQYRHKLPIP